VLTLPPPQATGAARICVALVVDFGSLGGGVDSTCASVRRGATGYDVLTAGGHRFVICSNGVLGNIDGKPADGCTEKNDSEHFWSYWHRAPGASAWTYSTEGGGSYQPANASTEGWHWMKSPPRNVPYGDICTPSPSASPSPSRSPASGKPAGPTPTAHDVSGRPRPIARARPDPSPSPATAAAPAPSPTPTPAPTTTAVAEPAHGATGGTSPYVLGGVVGGIALLGGAALARMRRGRGTP
jgi:hypothetical protein